MVEDKDFQIRFLTPADIPSIFAIEKIAYYSPWTEETFERCFQMHYVAMGLEDENHLYGYVFFSLQVGECHILNLCVNPREQRKGLGRQLLMAALQEAKAKGAGVAYLEVRRSNKSAIALYDKTGFVQIGERKKYYPSDDGGEDALVFAKDLGL